MNSSTNGTESEVRTARDQRPRFHRPQKVLGIALSPTVSHKQV